MAISNFEVVVKAVVALVVTTLCYSPLGHAQVSGSGVKVTSSDAKSKTANKNAITAAQPPSPPKVPEWVRRTVFNAELALLVERYLNTHYVTASGVETGENAYQSFRARIGFFTQLEREVGLGFRISTGSAHNSTYEALTGWGAKKPFNLDLAYFDYRPIKNLSFQAGKVAHPYWFAGGNEIVFESSVSFEGLQFKWSGSNPSFRPWVAFSYYALLDRLSAASVPDDVAHGSDLALAAAQVGVSASGGLIGFDLGVSLFNYNGIKGLDVAATGVADSPFFGITPSYNNSVVTDGGRNFYENDYSILNVGAEISLKTKIPISLFGEVDVNQRAASAKKALVTGVSIGAIEGRGTVFAQYSYRDVEKDSVFGMVADNAFLGGGPGGRGHRGFISVGLSRRASAGLLVDIGRKLISDEMRTFESGIAEIRFVY